jgi:hypothetical protein
MSRTDATQWRPYLRQPGGGLGETTIYQSIKGVVTHEGVIKKT